MFRHAHFVAVPGLTAASKTLCSLKGTYYRRILFKSGNAKFDISLESVSLKNVLHRSCIFSAVNYQLRSLRQFGCNVLHHCSAESLVAMLGANRKKF